MASNFDDVVTSFLNRYRHVDARPRWLPKDVVLTAIISDGPIVEFNGYIFYPLHLVTNSGLAYRFVAVEVVEGSTKGFIELFEAPAEVFGSYMKARVMASQGMHPTDFVIADLEMTPLLLDQTNSAFLVGDSIFAKYYRKVDEFNREATYYEKMETSAAITPYYGKVLDSSGRIESLFTGSLKDPKSLFQVTVDAISLGNWSGVADKIHDAGVALGEVHAAIEAVGAKVEDLIEWYSKRCAVRGDRLHQGVVTIDLSGITYSVDVGETLGTLSGRITTRPAHGDFHLGQCLIEGDRIVVIDFEGEPVGEANQPFDTPFRDLSGALRSISYLVGVASGPEAVVEMADRVIEMRKGFLEGYVSTASGAELVLSDSCTEAVAFFEFEKACYELLYEKTFRPEWIDIPASSIRIVGDALKNRSSWESTQGIDDRIESIANFYRR